MAMSIGLCYDSKEEYLAAGYSRLQVAEFVDHVGHQLPVSFPVCVYSEFQARWSGALVVVKKIGALSPEAEDVPLFSEDHFGFPAKGFPKRIFSKYQMADL